MAGILSVTSSRADVGILAPVWYALMQTPGAELHLFATGMHLAPDAPPLPALPQGTHVHRGGADLGGAEPRAAAEAMGAITASAGRLYHEVAPDAVLVMGDRLDMLPAAVAAVAFNVPLVHLHGGEVTEGALDDRARHAISKLAHVHCVSTAGARDRLLALGEEPWRIHQTGAPGIDTLLQAPAISRREFLDAMDFATEPDDTALRLVTVHPETNSAEPAAAFEAVLSALDAHPLPTLLTAPNRDPGGAAMLERLKHYVATRPWARLRDTLGPFYYPNALRHADVMIGNSSSGIIEAGAVGLTVINVGDRQKGREAGDNVISVAADAAAIAAALDRLGARSKCYPMQTLYGDGRAGARVAAVLRRLPARDALLRKRLTAD